ncbi:MAG: hypothetical protein M1368_06745 [Thaumarchaeota archaeon]|nr:hypothetical protein [Nitrososphaerota archaeon]
MVGKPVSLVNDVPTQKTERLSLRTLIIFATAWDGFVVAFGISYDPPFLNSTGLSSPPPQLMTLFYSNEAMFFHALAIPFIAVLVYATLLICNVKGQLYQAIKISITGSFFLASPSALFIMLFGQNSSVFGVLWIGLALGMLAAILLIIALRPTKSKNSEEMNLHGANLANLVVWTGVMGVLSATIVGAYASTGESQWGALTTIPHGALITATHIHVVISIVDAALVGLIVKAFRADRYIGIPGLFIKIGLYGTLLGIPTTTIATYATVPMGIEAHNGIEAFAAILLQSALFITYAIIYTEAKKLGTRYTIGILKNMMTFGLLFILFWVNVVVTLPGMYVAINLARFQGGPNEQVFITGHEHILVTLTALTLLMLIAKAYKVRGKLDIISGLTLTTGYLLSTGATIPFIFYNWDPYTSPYVPYIMAGIVLMMIGVATTLIGLALSKERSTEGTAEITAEAILQK